MTDTEHRVLLSFDVEEFDLPLEFGGSISEKDQLAIGRQGLEEVLALLDELSIPATLFSTAHIADHAAELVRNASRHHEIASHGVFHSQFKPEDFATSRNLLQAISETEVRGFRMARLQPVDSKQVHEAGYEYDSSENPIRLPGRYDNRHLPRVPRLENGVVRIPISTTPKIRMPLFWLAFRHLPRPLLRLCLKRTVRHDGHLVLFFHPWELLDLRQYRNVMPTVVRHGGGKSLRKRLKEELSRLSQYASFTLMRPFAEAEAKRLRAEEATNAAHIDTTG